MDVWVVNATTGFDCCRFFFVFCLFFGIRHLRRTEKPEGRRWCAGTSEVGKVGTRGRAQVHKGIVYVRAAREVEAGKSNSSAGARRTSHERAAEWARRAAAVAALPEASGGSAGVLRRGRRRCVTRRLSHEQASAWARRSDAVSALPEASEGNAGV